MRKFLSNTLSAILIALSLSGCNAASVSLAATDKLSVYIGSTELENSDLNRISRIYSEIYPDVKIDFVTASEFGGDVHDTTAFRRKINSEIMAGNAPDIIYFEEVMPLFGDIVKTMESGVFYDISDLMEADTDFDIEQYYKPIIDAGKIDGQQLVVPISFNLPMYLTTEEALGNSNIPLDQLETYPDFFNQIAKYIENNPKNQRVITHNSIRYDNILEYYKIADYEMKTVDINNDLVLNAFEQMYNIMDVFKQSGTSDMINSEMQIAKLIDDTMIFIEANNQHSVLNQALLTSAKQTPIIFPVRNSENKLQAVVREGLSISSNSKNVINAYNFIKVALNPFSHLGDNPDYDSMTDEVKYFANQYTFAPLKNWLRLGVEVVEKEHRAENSQHTLPANFYANYLEIFDQIDSCTIPSGVSKKLMFDLNPYFNDEKSLDECIKTAQSAMEIYISE